MTDERLSGPKITRATAARARGEIRAVGIRAVPGDRTPRAVVDLALPGGVVVGFTISRRRRGNLVVDAPEAADGKAAICLPDEIEPDAVRDVALDAAKRDPMIWRHLSLPGGMRR